jgi:hypothetical protein
MENQIEKPLIRASHVIANEDSYQLHKDVEGFIKDKPNVTTLKNSTPVVAGMTMMGKQPVANMKVIVTCLVEWDSTEENFRLFRKRLELTGKPF